MKKIIFLSFLILAVTFSQRVTAQDTVKEELLKAQNLVKQGQGAEASAILVKIMQNHPDNKEAVQWWLVANMKRSPTGPVDADKQLDSLGNLYPNNTGILFFKSFILTNLGRNEEALAGLENLIKLQPDSAVNWITKGQVLIALKRYEEAFLAFDKASLLDPSRIDVWGMKAATLAQMKKYDEALMTINKGIKLSPDNVVNYYNRACIYCKKGNKANALADLKKAIEGDSQFKKHAKTDEDFKSLWEDEDFKKLIE